MAPLHKSVRKQSSLLAKTKNRPFGLGFLFSTFVLSPGVEPGALVPQTSILSIKLRERASVMKKVYFLE